jgi:Tfp pilus assembly protein FimT
MELILVLAILTVVVALIAPSLRWFGIGRTSNDTATRLVSLAHYARDQAIAEARPYRLNFDPEGHAYWLTMEEGGVFQPAANDYGLRFELPEGLQMDLDVPQAADGQYITFNPNGRTQSAHIRLTNKVGGRLEIACLSATEQFHILRPEEMTP